MGADSRTWRATLRRHSGRDWQAWCVTLDARGAGGWTHGRIVAFLREAGITQEWAQRVAAEYGHARGIPTPGRRADGTFAAQARKTIAAASPVVFDLWAVEERRAQWLPDTVLALRTASRPRRLCFDFGNGDDVAEPVTVELHSRGRYECRCRVSHEGIADLASGTARQAWWHERLLALRTAARQYHPLLTPTGKVSVTKDPGLGCGVRRDVVYS